MLQMFQLNRYDSIKIIYRLKHELRTLGLSKDRYRLDVPVNGSNKIDITLKKTNTCGLFVNSEPTNNSRTHTVAAAVGLGIKSRFNVMLAHYRQATAN